MAHISSGTSLTATSFNGLLTRLEAVRKNHLNKNGQSSAANTALSTAFNTKVAVAGNKAMSSNV